jgi:hypothetical protein
VYYAGKEFTVSASNRRTEELLRQFGVEALIDNEQGRDYTLWSDFPLLSAKGRRSKANIPLSKDDIFALLDSKYSKYSALVDQGGRLVAHRMRDFASLAKKLFPELDVWLPRYLPKNSR